jgi:hypothetical protein
MGYSLRFNHVPKETNMLSKPSHQLLRYVLWADAISCLACGVLQVAFTGSVSQYLGLPLTLLGVTGDFLLLYGAAVAFLAIRARAPTGIIWLLIVGNVAWGLAAVSILLEGDVRPTLLGKGYILAQTLTVLILARLQYVCVRPSKVHLVG